MVNVTGLPLLESIQPNHVSPSHLLFVHRSSRLKGTNSPRGLRSEEFKKSVFLYNEGVNEVCMLEFTQLYNCQQLECVVPENIHTPPQKGLEFRGGGGFSKTENFKEMYGI